MIGATLGHYRVEEKIGEGGMGIVYKAFDSRLLRHVAIKILPVGLVTDEKRLDRFNREARVASALNHPNICSVYDIGEQNGIHYIIMEYVQGQTLRDVLEQRGSLPEKEAIEIGRQVCDALTAAHAKNIIHRDIKPDNIMLTKDGQVKVLDFGLATLANTNVDMEPQDAGNGSFLHTADLAKTSFSTIQGTVSYMSPEQINHDNVDVRTDICSLGVVLYEMLTGKTPFAGEDSLAVMKAILKKSPQKPSGHNKRISRKMDSVVLQALAKNRQQRFKNINELKRRLTRSSQSKIRLIGLLGIFPLLLLLAYSGMIKRSSPANEKQPVAQPFLKLQTISYNESHLAAPFFDVDGKLLVMAKAIKSPGQRHSLVLYTKDIETGEIERKQLLFNIEHGTIIGDYAPTGGVIAFSVLGSKEGIYIIDPTTQSQEKLLNFGVAPRWAPDEKRIVFTNSGPTSIAENSAIYLVSEQKPLTL